ncbi:NAD(P)H-dependent oxidoreductase [Streptomyces sp. P38-E01]|uniref:NAD(P)H-dependent oxidoreductase n=1 Tax=Streptomyces tardus TaxID=2780544 RepID=A0A949N8Z4_9ACTN|nr:NAD(P)H-dependent oxidoreductase [Streptomyces tardus]MBU7598413.1 NAD(P)H-dependent oxidoreductase [Streptomyces tardus]
MNILWIFAHPEQRSLNASLRDEGLAELEAAGHSTRLTDLYAIGFNPVVGRSDFEGDLAGRDGTAGDGTGRDGSPRLRVGEAQERGYAERTLSADILAEQEKVAWADVLVFQFPLWWFGPPAILKGWFDRVFVQGFAFGIEDEQGRVMRYGRGPLSGRRALVVTTVGGRATAFEGRGVHGHLEDVLHPLLHGTFWYAGIEALPPFLVPGADRLDERGYADHARALRTRLRELPGTTPIPYRAQNDGDYDEQMLLRPELAPGRTDLAAHRTDSAALRTDADADASRADTSLAPEAADRRILSPTGLREPEQGGGSASGGASEVGGVGAAAAVEGTEGAPVGAR